jgi:hypothetical protein
MSTDVYTPDMVVLQDGGETILTDTLTNLELDIQDVAGINGLIDNLILYYMYDPSYCGVEADVLCKASSDITPASTRLLLFSNILGARVFPKKVLLTIETIKKSKADITIHAFIDAYVSDDEYASYCILVRETD